MADHCWLCRREIDDDDDEPIRGTALELFCTDCAGGLCMAELSRRGVAEPERLLGGGISPDATAYWTDAALAIRLAFMPPERAAALRACQSSADLRRVGDDQIGQIFRNYAGEGGELVTWPDVKHGERQEWGLLPDGTPVLFSAKYRAYLLAIWPDAEFRYRNAMSNGGILATNVTVGGELVALVMPHRPVEDGAAKFAADKAAKEGA